MFLFTEKHLQMIWNGFEFVGYVSRRVKEVNTEYFTSTHFQSLRSLKLLVGLVNLVDLLLVSLPQAYPGGVPVTAAKKKDLMSLLPYIRDETHKAFYEGLRSTEDDPNAEGEDDEKQEE